MPRVYPRPHGEAPKPWFTCWTLTGLSPPTRGSPSPTRSPPALSGSIPAHTGKPAPRRTPSATPRVYPRPHGEAAGSMTKRRSGRGLSPPTRGSRGVDDQEAERQGSIPAHTGKPPARRAMRRAFRVYPRPHGEAVRDGGTGSFPTGLSPPTRGSPRPAPRASARSGSIPAHTGKPPTCPRRPTTSRVYPRPHGEAVAGSNGGAARVGLSPPTRGSPDPDHGRAGGAGSIPAHTGKPPRTGACGPLLEVYPRPHGEADLPRNILAKCGGLSPPTRGSLCSRTGSERLPGSIPAHTGKPEAPSR